MDSVLLEFRNANLERQFDRYMNEAYYWSVDSYFVWLEVVAHACTAATFVQHGRLSAAPCLALGLNVGSLVWFLYLRNQLGRANMLASRTRTILALRSIHTFALALLHLHVPCQIVATPTSPLMLLVHLCMANGMTVSLLVAGGLRMKFKHNLCHLLLSNIILLFCKAHTFCNCMLSTPQGSLLLALEERLSMLSRALSLIAHALFSFFAIKLGPAGIVRPKPCFQMLTMTELYIGVVVVSYLMWLLERRSRMHFLKPLWDEGHANGNGDIPTPDDFPKISWMSHIGCLVIGFALCWEYLAWLPYLVQTWGARGIAELSEK